MSNYWRRLRSEKLTTEQFARLCDEDVYGTDSWAIDDDPTPDPLPAGPFRLRWWHGVTFALGFTVWIAIGWLLLRSIHV